MKEVKEKYGEENVYYVDRQENTDIFSLMQKVGEKKSKRKIEIQCFALPKVSLDAVL